MLFIYNINNINNNNNKNDIICPKLLSIYL